MGGGQRITIPDLILESLSLSRDCEVVLHRTLRIPDDGGDYPLPPSLGPLPLLSVGEDEFVAPMRRAEAMRLGFDAPFWKPRALKIGTGGIDAISGEDFEPSKLSAKPQDYVVIPDQPWLDGINAGDGFIRQFVAVPLGEGLTVEAQLTGQEKEGGLVLSLFEPKPGKFPDEGPAFEEDRVEVMACAAPMGLGAGGRMRQEICDDEYGIRTWEPAPARTVRVDLVDALAFEALTGFEVPGPPVDAETYTRHGLPWCDLLAPTKRDIAAAERLASVRSIADLEGRDEEPLPISGHQVRRLFDLRTAARQR
jgi:hypothetical protein